MQHPSITRWIRTFRGVLYRQIPSWSKRLAPKRRVGFERRWNLEADGFTKEGLVCVLRGHVLRGIPPGAFFELAVGDGLVGSLGIWLEHLEGWNVEAWEHRPVPRHAFRVNRPKSSLHESRLTAWSRSGSIPGPVGITTRGAREAAGVCRAIRQGLIRPRFFGIWNPTRRSAWERRLRREGYCLKLIWHNMEFYGDKKPASDTRIQW